MNYDTIVVGAGSTGSVVASRISEDPSRSVLLIEAGPYYPSLEQTPEEIIRALPRDINLTSKLLGPDSAHDWAYKAKATNKLDEIPIPRGRVVGGSSSVNSSIFLRGTPEDYDAWALAGNEKWGYDQLIHYLRDIEQDEGFNSDIHGSSGPTPVTRFGEEAWAPEQTAFYKTCISAGYAHCSDQNHPNSTGVGPLPFNIKNGIRWSSQIAYLNGCDGRSNLTIMGESFARRLLFENGRTVGIEIEHGNRISSFFSGDIIVSAGAIGSPKLLMLSGIGAAPELEELRIPVVNDLPGVGKNLWDHPQTPVIFETVGEVSTSDTTTRLQVGLRYTAHESDFQNDMFILPALFTSHTAFDKATSPKTHTLSLIPCVYLAQSLGEVRIQSTDPRQAPVINFNYLSDPFDVLRLREGVRICADIGSSIEFNTLIDRRTQPIDEQLESDNRLDDWMMNNVRTSHHCAGTCKMGPSSQSMTVVDQHGNVHGVDGLRIADASIMPTGIRANTHLTSVVIGERIAGFVSQGL